MRNYFEILNEVITSLVKNKHSSFKDAYGRFLYQVGANSFFLNKFYNKKNKNNKFFFNSNELEIAQEIYKKFFFNKKLKLIKIETEIAKNKILILLKNTINLIKLYFFQLFFFFKKNNRVKILFYVHDIKYINYINKFVSKNKNYYYLLLTNYKILFNKNIKFNKCLRKIGEKYILYNCRNEKDFKDNYSVFRKTFLKYKPKQVVFLEGDSPEHSNITKACKELGIESICLQWGTIPTSAPKYGFRYLKCSKFLLHGSYVFNQLVRYNNKKILKIVGNPSIDNNINVDIKKINKKAIFLLQGLSIFFTQRDYRLFLKFIYYVIKNNKDWLFILRPHPSSELNQLQKNIFNKFKNCKIVDSKEISLSESIIDCDIAFSAYSSSLTECIQCNIIPFAFNPSVNLGRYYPDLNRYKIGYDYKDYNKAIVAAMNLLNNTKKIYFFKTQIKKKKSFLCKDVGEVAVNNIKKFLIK